MTDIFRPIIAITMGDPAGIGPEIVIKAMQESHIYRICRPVIIGDAGVIRNTLSLGSTSMDVNQISDLSEALSVPYKIDVYDLNNVNPDELRIGKIAASSGKAAFEAVQKAIELAVGNRVHATVTGPINKESINLAGYRFSGHTEIYARYTNTDKYAMLLVNGNLRVIHVSTHVSVRQACDLVQKDRILDVIKLIHDACGLFGIMQPKIGVAGLNPHASDGGLFGYEEESEIIPAIAEACKLGYNAVGPIPADTLFAKAKGGFYDGCVAMYHDQGHIPFKFDGFLWDTENQQMKSVTGVNITLGLPIIRTSVDHGTAMDIAGKGVASPDALLLAIEYAVKMSRGKFKA